MNEHVKELLKKHGYTMKVYYDKTSYTITLKIPRREQHPITDEINIDYSIDENKVSINIDGIVTDVDCPIYACRTLIFVDIRKQCEYFHFDASLLEFYNGDDIINETDFFNLMWPPYLEFTEDIRKKEDALKELVTRAINAIIPFHIPLNFEAQQMGVGLGYGLIRSFAVGGEK